MLRGEDGGKQRLLHIGNYVLTGAKVGPKGYYNSFAGFTPTGNLIVQKGIINKAKQGWQDFLHPMGLSNGYSGFVNSAGKVPMLTERKDLIDAFLYGEEIDPSFGLRRVAIGDDFGFHSKFIKDNYPSKAHDIPVYEMNTPNPISKSEVTESGIWEGVDNGLFRGDGNNYANVAGHMMQKGTTSSGESVNLRQDIWKFRPEDYYERWLKNKRDYEEMSPFAKRFTNFVLGEVDRLGTPIIIRTKWNKANNFGQ